MSYESKRNGNLMGVGSLVRCLAQTACCGYQPESADGDGRLPFSPDDNHSRGCDDYAGNRALVPDGRANFPIRGHGGEFDERRSHVVGGRRNGR